MFRNLTAEQSAVKIFKKAEAHIHKNKWDALCIIGRETRHVIKICRSDSSSVLLQMAQLEIFEHTSQMSMYLFKIVCVCIFDISLPAF